MKGADRWRLRQVMASREVWTAKQLRELLAQRAGLKLSKQSISDLINKQQVQVKVKTLEALCTALQCTPNELFGVDTAREVSITAEPDHANRDSANDAARGMTSVAVVLM